MDLNQLSLKIARSENLPVLSNVVTQVLKLADDPNASPRTLEKIIERDPALTAKILRVGNSSYYGMSQVSSIGRAISVLGMNTIRSLVIGVAYQQILGARTVAQKFDKMLFWKHSLAVAVGSRILMKITQPLKSEELYVAGMMHDVGLLVMDKFAPSELDGALKVSIQDKIPLHIAEQSLYGFDHAQIGGLLAEKWKLTGTIGNAIKFHEDPYQDRETAVSTLVVSAANNMAYVCGFPNVGGVAVQELNTEFFEKLEIAVEQIEPIMGVIIAEVVKASEAFGIKSAA